MQIIEKLSSTGLGKLLHRKALLKKIATIETQKSHNVETLWLLFLKMLSLSLKFSRCFEDDDYDGSGR